MGADDERSHEAAIGVAIVRAMRELPPHKLEITITIEHGTASVELFDCDEGRTIDVHDEDMTLAEKIIAAIDVAKGY